MRLLGVRTAEVLLSVEPTGQGCYPLNTVSSASCAT